MEKIFKLAALVAASLAIFSCTPDNGDGTGDGNGNGGSLNQNLTFTLGDPEVEATQVKVRVEHNGDKEDPWYYFVTTESDVDEAITAEVKRIKEANEEVTLKKTTKTNVTVKDLTPETEYTLVVIGLTAEYEYYGTPASVEFKTTAERVESLTQTEDWKISYERGEYQGESAEIFEIACNDNLSYYLTYIDKWSLDYYKMTVADYALYAVEFEIPQMLNFGYTLEQLIVTGPETLAFPRLVSDEYWAITVGITPDGKNATGNFSAIEFTVVEEEATAEYNQWLGTWKFTSAPYSYNYVDKNGETITVEIKDYSYTIEIAHYDNNYKYAIGGWECGENVYVDMNDMFLQPIYFPASFHGGKIGFEEYYITELSASEGSTKPELAFGLWGVAEVRMGNQTGSGYTGLEGFTMAMGEMNEDGTGTISGLSYELPEEGFDELNYVAMSYAAFPMVEGVDFAVWNEYMMFPITMEKLSDAVAPSALKSLNRTPRQRSQDSEFKSLRLKNSVKQNIIRNF